MKGISPIEQHLEKIVLAIAIIVLLAAFYTQFIAQPHSINEGSPAEVKEKVLDEIDNLRRRLDGPSNVPDYAVSGFREHFASAVDDDAIGRLRIPDRVGQLPPPPPTEIEDAPAYNLPTPPLATDLQIAHGHALLATDAAGGQGNVTNDLIQRVGGRAPYDFQYVSVAATFPFAEWIRRLETGPVRDRVPPRWWGSRRLLAGVVLQRQELNPATGQWSSPVIIEPIPGQLGFIENAEQTWQPGEVQQALLALSDQQTFVQQPPFAPTRAGVPWTPPGEGLASLDPATHRELRDLFEDLATTRDRLDRLMEREQRTQNRPQRETPTRRPARQPTGGAAGMGGGMGADGIGGPGAGATPTPNRPQPASQLERLQQQEDELIQEIIAILLPEQAQDANNNFRNQPGPGMGGMGMGGMGMGGMGGPAGGFGGPIGGGIGGRPGVNPGQQASSAITEPTIRVWAHDITVEPGKTYRYRVIVNVLNPLFRRSSIEAQQRAENYRKVALGPSQNELANAPWSEPVNTDPQTFFWLADGSLQQQEAEIEIWTRFAGRWERLEERFQPGDTISGRATIQGPLGVQSLRMDTGSTMIDYASLGTGAASAALLFTTPDKPDLATRSVDDDRSNINYVRLLNEVDAIDFLQEFGGGAGRSRPSGPGMPPPPGMGGMGGGMGGPVF
ncbi:MAG: hypothetical protein RLN76_06240 [Phycisphaeraceae bacterium]